MILVLLSDEENEEYGGLLATHFRVTSNKETYEKEKFNEHLEVLVFTEEVLEGWFTPVEIEKEVAGLLEVKSNTRVLLIGESIDYTIKGAITINTNWRNPNNITKSIDEIYQYRANATSSIIQKMEEEIFRRVNDSMAFCDYILDDKLHFTVLSNLLSSKYDSSSKFTKSENSNSTLRVINEQQNEQIKGLETKLSTMKNKYNTIYSMYNDIYHTANKSYGLPIDDEYSIGHIVNQEDSSIDTILYFKEISSVRYCPTLIANLIKIKRQLSKEVTKLIVIGPSGNISSMYDYTLDLVDVLEATTDDIKHSDLYLSGYSSEIINSVLKDTEVDNLIIYDRTKLDTPIVDGSKVKTIYIDNTMDIKERSYEKERVITYSNSTLCVPHIKGFDSMSTVQRLQRYSEFISIKILLKLLEG